MRPTDSPPPAGEMVNVILAARRAGDRVMERRGRDMLVQRHGIRLVFLCRPARGEATHR